MKREMITMTRIASPEETAAAVEKAMGGAGTMKLSAFCRLLKAQGLKTSAPRMRQWLEDNGLAGAHDAKERGYTVSGISPTTQALSAGLLAEDILRWHDEEGSVHVEISTRLTRKGAEWLLTTLLYPKEQHGEDGQWPCGGQDNGDGGKEAEDGC